MKIYFASDHAGFELKEKLKGALSLFSRKAEEEVKVVEEVLEDVEETPKKETEKKEVQKRVKEEKIIEEKEEKMVPLLS